MSFDSLVPMLRTWDWEGTLNFYEDVLGFNCDQRDDSLQWAHLHCDAAKIMISGPNAHLEETTATFTGSLYFYCQDVDAAWHRLRSQTQVCYPLEDFDYGMREFAIYDNNGYMLKFGQALPIQRGGDA